MSRERKEGEPSGRGELAGLPGVRLGNISIQFDSFQCLHWCPGWTSAHGFYVWMFSIFRIRSETFSTYDQWREIEGSTWWRLEWCCIRDLECQRCQSSISDWLPPVNLCQAGGSISALREANNNKHPDDISQSWYSHCKYAHMVSGGGTGGDDNNNWDNCIATFPPPPGPHSLRARHLLTWCQDHVRPIRVSPLSQAIIPPMADTDVSPTWLLCWARMGRNVKICWLGLAGLGWGS